MSSGEYHKLLFENLGVSVACVLTDYEALRKECLDGIAGAIAIARGPCIIFLDVDTGVWNPALPYGYSTDPRYICPDELRQIYNAMSPGDVLMIYQHVIRIPNWAQQYAAYVERSLGARANITRLGRACVIAVEKGDSKRTEHK